MENKRRNKGYLLFVVLIILVILSIVGSIYAPVLTKRILSILWYISITLTASFVVIGILMILGLRKEANKLMNLYLEGSLTLIDIITFFRETLEITIKTVKNIIFSVTPMVAYTLVAFFFYMLMILYKSVGKTRDVTVMTILLTIFFVVIVSILNLPESENGHQSKWLKELAARFSFHFSDGLEVAIFVFFLTMDSTKLFFLPKALRVPLTAKLFNYDLMGRGYSFGATKTTLLIATIAITSELVRNVLRIIAVARDYYESSRNVVYEKTATERGTLIKKAVRKSFNEARDEFAKFVAFTTILLAVFLAFPRLKLLSMAVGSITALCVDLIITKRLVVKKGEDLLSRSINKMFKL